jgi:hypothetical protein
MKNIHILTVSNEEIKKRKGFTGADWWWDDEDTLQIRVAAELEDWRERAALMLHEAFEALLCKHNGVTVAQVDEFDAKFKGENEIDVNAGDESDAPYRLEHTYATAIERVFTGAAGVDWKAYDTRLGLL